MRSKMRHMFAGLPLAILLIANVFPSLAQSAVAGGAGGAGDEDVLEVAEGAPLRLRCSLRVEQRVQWRREGGPLADDLRAAGEAAAAGAGAGAGAGALQAELRAAAARPAHAGRYTCAAGGRATRLVVLPAEAAAEAGGEPTLVQYDVRGNLSLRCPLSTDPADPALPIVWSKNGTTVDKVEELKNRYSVSEGGAVLQVTGRSVEEDFGNYSCSAGAARAELRVHARTHAKLPDNTNVVEGQKLKLTCRLVGKPYPPVTWLFANDTWPNGTDVAAALGADRVKLGPSEQQAPGAQLQLDAARRSDAGVYSCVPAGAAPDSTTLRVKDMYAALWPFLGIVAEVLALCAVILVYERRRPKQEPDDSDADHDTKKS